MEESTSGASELATASATADEELRGSELVSSGDNSAQGIPPVCDGWRFRYEKLNGDWRTQHYCQHVTGPWRETHYGSEAAWKDLHRTFGDTEKGSQVAHDGYKPPEPEPDPFSDSYEQLWDNQPEGSAIADIGTTPKRSLDDKRPERRRARESLHTLGRRDKRSSTPPLFRIEGEVDTGREDQGKEA